MAEISNLITDNKTATSVVSTISEHVAAYAFFLPLHAKDNQDTYRTNEGNFKRGDFIKDQIKLTGSFARLDLAYLSGRPIITKEILETGVNPSQASLYADAITYPALLTAAIPLAKITGNIRSRGKLEEKVEEITDADKSK